MRKDKLQEKLIKQKEKYFVHNVIGGQHFFSNIYGCTY